MTADDVDAAADDLFVVRMLELPLQLRDRSRQHGADLLREMTLMQSGHASGTTRREVPERLLRLAEELDTVYRPYVAASNDEMDDALDRGETTLPEVVYRLPSAGAGFVQRVDDVLAEVEEYCRSDDHLLTLAPPEDVAAYRRWSMSEVLRQHAGLEPTPWPTYAARAGASSPAP